MYLSKQTSSYGASIALSTPTVPAANLDDLGDMLRLELSGGVWPEESLLERLLLMASQHAGQYLNRSLINQQWRRAYDPARAMPGLAAETFAETGCPLPYGKVAVTAGKLSGAGARVYIVSGAGTEMELDDYFIDAVSSPARAYLRTGIAGQGWSFLHFDYNAGYGADYTAVPVAIQQGILQHAAYMYEHRGDCGADEAAKLSGAHTAYGMFRVSVI